MSRLQRTACRLLSALAKTVTRQTALTTLSSLLLFSTLMPVAQAATTPTTTALTASPNPAQVGQSVTIGLTVSNGVGSVAPSGSLTLKDGSTTLATLTLTPSASSASSASSGTSSSTATASTTLSTLSLGTHTLTADYAGDTTNAASSASPLIVTVSAPVITTGQYLYEYNALGQLQRSTTPLGAPTEQAWDSLGRLATQKLPNAAGAGTLDTIGYTYDGQGQIQSLTDPRNQKTTYATNGLGNTTVQNSPDTGTTGYQYDAAGNLTQKTDARGKITQLTYDALNRPTTMDAGDELSTYTYDQGSNGAGRLTQLTNPASTLQWHYNAQGQITDRIQIIAAGQNSQNTSAPTSLTQIIHTSYDAYGRIDTLIYPSGRQLKYSYTPNGQIASLTLDGQAVLSNLTYTPFGPVKSWVWGNAQTYSRSYDINGRMNQFTVGDGTRSLIWDAASRITSITEQTLGGTTKPVASANYDNQDRLTQYNSATASYTYGYDATSNRSQLSLNGTTYPYTTDGGSNRLTNTSGPAPAKNYLYDAAGNPTTDGTRATTWNNSGRLTSLTQIGSGTLTTYTYNALAQRISKTGNSTAASYYAYDEAGHLMGEYDANGNPTAEHIWLGDTPIAMVKGAGIVSTSGTTANLYYVFADQIDTPKALADATGKIVWQWDGEGFGASQPNEDPDADGQKVSYNLRFPGQLYDQESGLHYNYFRYYDPQTGRYISSDPIGLQGGMNTYAYVKGNPVSYTDPTGTQVVQGGGLIVGGIIVIGGTAIILNNSPGARSAAQSTANSLSNTAQKVGEMCSREACKAECVAKYERDAIECGVAYIFWKSKGYQACMSRAGEYLAECLKQCDGK